MTAEVAAYNESIRMRLEAAVAFRGGLRAAHIDWRPSPAHVNIACAAVAQRAM